MKLDEEQTGKGGWPLEYLHQFCLSAVELNLTPQTTLDDYEPYSDLWVKSYFAYEMKRPIWLQADFSFTKSSPKPANEIVEMDT